MNQQDQPALWKIVALLAIGMITFGFAPILVRLAEDIHPVMLVAIRTVSAALILLPFWLWNRYSWARDTTWSPKNNGKALLAGSFLGLHFICWTASLFYTSVASASVLVTIHPVMLIIIESAFMRAKFPKMTWIGVLVAFAGSALLGLTDRDPSATYSDPVFGNILAFLAALLFIGYILLSQGLRKEGTWLEFVFRVYAGTAIISVLAVVVFQIPWYAGVAGWVCGIALAIGPQIIGHGSVNYAVKFVPPTILSTLILSEPVFATILAVLIFAEIPGVIQSAAMLIIITGVITGWFGRMKRTKKFRK